MGYSVCRLRWGWVWNSRRAGLCEEEEGVSAVSGDCDDESERTLKQKSVMVWTMIVMKM